MPKFLEQIDRAVIRKDRKLLHQQYPKAFRNPSTKGLKMPLKLGIHNDVLARGLIDPTTGHKLPALRVKAAIWSYCSSPEYYASVARGDARVDLDGLAAGEISEVQKAHAKAYLKRYHEKMKTKRKAAAVAA